MYVFGGHIVFVGSLLNYAGLSSKNHKPPLNFRIGGACRRALRRMNNPSLPIKPKRCRRADLLDASALSLLLLFFRTLLTATASVLAQIPARGLQSWHGTAASFLVGARKS